MKKIAFVVQRYGIEVNGGAELLCRQLAEKMCAFYDITVLTTKAIDYATWKNEYTSDVDNVNGIHVIRFETDHERVRSEFDNINGRFLTHGLPKEDEQKWIDLQGPYVPKLINYIANHKNDYELFIFFTYLYYPTVMGVPLVKDKSIVFPFAHNEPFLQMRIFDNVFRLPAAFCFQTDEERELIRHKYRNYDIPFTYGGAGVDVPSAVSGEKFCNKFHLNHYIIYVGRIDAGKNCPQMFEYFIKYKEKYPSDLKLILLGKTIIDIPKCSDIIPLGFVSDEDKFNGIAGSDFLILPSKFESLSIVVLEAMSLKKPVLVNGQCPVLRGHCIKSQGGLYYSDYETFETKMLQLEYNANYRKKLGERGYLYVQKNYNWDIICQKFCKLIERTISNQ